MIRLLHFSDVHVHVPAWRVPLRDWLGKRLLGGGNMLLHRRQLFRDTRAKLAALARFTQAERIDVALCTGDYTGLGTLPELQAARACITPVIAGVKSFVTVPGNHDLYLWDAVEERRFERVFGDVLGSDWPIAAEGESFPAVRLYEDHLAVITVNSARPNPPLFRSSGRIPDAQLSAVAQLLRDPRLAHRTVLIATHYAPRRADGSPDRFTHGLENADALLDLGTRLPRVGILHGHIHGRFHVHCDAGPHLFGAGSATHAGREGAWLFEFERGRARAYVVRYANAQYVADAQPAVEF